MAAVSKMTESFQEAFRPVIKLSQYFGVFPIDFVDKNNPKKIVFRWKSLKTIYSLIFIVCCSIECSLSLRLAVTGGSISLSGSSGFTYLFVSGFGAMCLLRLAHKWPKLMEQWEKHEIVFVTDPAYRIEGMSLKKKI